MEQINRIELRGVIGNVSVNEVGTGRVLNFSLKTEYCYKKDGNPMIEDTWHRVRAWEGRGMPDFDTIAKGMTLYVCGRVRAYRYTAADGSEKTAYEVVARKIQVEDEYCQPQL